MYHCYLSAQLATCLMNFTIRTQIKRTEIYPIMDKENKVHIISQVNGKEFEDPLST